MEQKLDAQNREQFLARIAAMMGRDIRKQPDPMPAPLNTYPTTRLTDRSRSELANEFENAAKAMMVDVNIVKEAEVTDRLLALCEKYGGGSVILNDDSRLAGLGITEAVRAKYNTHIWQPEAGESNISFAGQANIGVVYAEYGLAETGGIVLFSDEHFGRSVSLLPEKSIVIVRKSKVLPRVAQLGRILHEKSSQGERMPSCINIISGPSSTADIELIKVVGVHGPIAKIYIVIDDLD